MEKMLKNINFTWAGLESHDPSYLQTYIPQGSSIYVYNKKGFPKKKPFLFS